MPAATTDLTPVLAAVTALENAARYGEALALVDSTLVTDDADRLALLMARASVVARRDYARGVPSGDDHPLDAAHELAAAIGTGPTTSWDLAMLHLRRQYADQLVSGIGPAGRDPQVVARMATEAARLRDTAPDDGRRGWALMCQGWISDNLRGDRLEAPDHYAAALALARRVDDPLLVFEAQRHLGDHAHDDGDPVGARERWEESTAAGGRARHIGGTLAQQLLLAVLHRDEGDEAGARAIATEVLRWADAIGAAGAARQAEAFLAGVDPTRPPEED